MVTAKRYPTIDIEKPELMLPCVMFRIEQIQFKESILTDFKVFVHYLILKAVHIGRIQLTYLAP